MEAIRPPPTAKEKAPITGGSTPAPSASFEEIAYGEKLAAGMIVSIEKEGQASGEEQCYSLGMRGSTVFERQLGIAKDGSKGEVISVRNVFGGEIAVQFHRAGWTRDAECYMYTPQLMVQQPIMEEKDSCLSSLVQGVGRGGNVHDVHAQRASTRPAMAPDSRIDGSYVSAPGSVAGDREYVSACNQLSNLKGTIAIPIPILQDSISSQKGVSIESIKVTNLNLIEPLKVTNLSSNISRPQCRDTEGLHTSEFPPLPIKKATPKTNLHPSSTLLASLEHPVTQTVASTDQTEESTRVAEQLCIEEPRSYAIAAKPTPIPSLAEFDCEGSCIKEHFEGMPSIHISTADHEKAKANLAYTLIMRFTRVRPKLEAIRGIIHGVWGLSKPATVGVLDSRRILIRLMNAEDLAAATSRNHGIIDKVPYSLFTWQSSLGRKAESPLCNKWLRLPGLQPELCVRTILSLIGNSFARFVEADPETTNTLKPAHPRICVEIDVSNPLPTKVFMQIGDADGYWQAIAFEGNPTYCSFCKMHGHTTPLCRKRILAEEKHTQRTTVPASRMVWKPKTTPPSVPEQPAIDALEHPVRADLQPARNATTDQPAIPSMQPARNVATSNRFASLDEVIDDVTLESVNDDARKEVIDEVGYSLVTKRRKNKSTQPVTIEMPARTRNRSSKEDLAPALDRPEQLFYNSSSKSKQRQAARNIIHGEASDTTADEEEPPDQLISEWEPGAPLL
nr:DUF4283 domain-containing protein [Erythronium dens-canis]